MIKCSKYTILAALIAFSSFANASGVWAGIEVMGSDFKTAQQIRALIPIKEGETVTTSDNRNLQAWCDKVKNGMKLKNIQCGLIGYPNGEFYYNVEISQGLLRKPYRQIPVSPIQHVTIPIKLKMLHLQWIEIFGNLVKSGKQPVESFDKGYLDTDQPELQFLAKKMSKYANKYNSTLLYIVRYSNDPKERSMAAELLSWSAQPKNLNFILDWDLMNDPVDSVRYYLMKSISCRLNTIDDKPLLRKTIRAFCQQTSLPSHHNRNKALFSLQRILSKHQDLTPYLHAECRCTISYISKMTVLPNVSNVAKDILYLAERPNKK